MAPVRRHTPRVRRHRGPLGAPEVVAVIALLLIGFGMWGLGFLAGYGWRADQ